MATIKISNLPPAPPITGTGVTKGTDLIVATDVTQTGVNNPGGTTKKYTQAEVLSFYLQAQGLTVYTACLGSTTVSLTATYDNGALGVGATLTNSGAQVVFTVDGVTFAVGNRVLVQFQAAPAQNGIYTVTTLGTTSTNWVLTRATDYDTSDEVVQYGVVLVNEGTLYAGKLFEETAAGPFTIGTSAIEFDAFELISGSVITFPIQVSEGGTGADNAADARVNLGLEIGVNVEAWSASLDALAALSGTGLVTQTGTNTFTQRTITGTTNQITTTNGSGVAGNPTLSLSSTLVLPGTLQLGGALDVRGFNITNGLTNGSVTMSTNGSGSFVLNSTQGITGVSNDGTFAADSSTLVPTQAAVKAYVDTIASGFTFIAPAVVTQATNFSATYSNGTAGVGATLTQSSAAVVTIDGVTLTINQRVLFTGQTSSFQNGVYQISTLGTGMVQAVFTRVTDYDTAAEIVPGSLIPITSGTTYGGSIWVETSTVATIGTDPITFQMIAQPSNTFVTLATTQTITGVKTFNSGSLKLAGATSGSTILNSAAIAGTSTLTLPAGTDTLVSLTSTGTLTNKTMSGASNTFSAIPYTALANATAGNLISWNAGGVVTAIGPGTSGYVLTSNGAGATPSFQASGSGSSVAPTQQVFTSGSGTYISPTSPAPTYIMIEMVGGGGGGGGSGVIDTGQSAGASGASTTFGTSLLTANYGTGGEHDGAGGAGTSGTINSPAYGVVTVGGSGACGSIVSGFADGASIAYGTSPGGNSYFGGSGASDGSSFNPYPGGNAAVNTGSGGGGAGISGSSDPRAAGSGGGAGTYIKAYISSPSSTYSYTVGAGGAGGNGGSFGNIGGNGADGIIIVTEYY